MNNLHVKKGDTVLVLAGKDKGKTGKVMSANPSGGTVIVENLNMITRHKKARNAQQQGGKITESGPVNVSNVQVICPACGKATRAGHGVAKSLSGNEIHVRLCKKCGANIDKKVEKKPAEKKAKKEKKAEEPAVENATANTEASVETKPKAVKKPRAPKAETVETKPETADKLKAVKKPRAPKAETVEATSEPTIDESK